MTTIAAIRTKHSVFIGADSRLSTGNLKMPTPFEKILVVNQQTCIASTGTVGLVQQLINRAIKNLKISKIEDGLENIQPNCEELAKSLSDLNFCLPLEHKQFHSAGFLIGGMIQNKPKLISVSEDGACIPNLDYWADGSGQQLALTVLQKSYNKNLQPQQAAMTVFSAIEAASQMDLYTDSRIRVFEISKSGVQEFKFTFKPKKTE